MDAIKCPKCGAAANAYGAVEHCWCNKSRCEHTVNIFAEFKCDHCEASGETPDAKRHMELQLEQFKAQTSGLVAKRLSLIARLIEREIPSAKVDVTRTEAQVVLANGKCRILTLFNPYETPLVFSLSGHGDVFEKDVVVVLQSLLNS